MTRNALALVLPLFLVACGTPTDPANPALWQVDCPDDRTGWLFGTVHALERPAEWRSEKIDKALAEADLLMVELADPDNAAASAQVWERLAKSPGHAPLSSRVAPAARKGLATALEHTGLEDDDFAEIETWAAALTLAQAASRELDSANGIDRAVISASAGKRIEELEGREAQLAIFDQLPEKEQRDLLAAVVADAARGKDEGAALAAAWRRGDMRTIELETGRGMLADPELREALFTGRNQRWTVLLLAAMKRGDRPFVAVGAAHLAGTEGLPAMLRGHGCTVTRTQ